MSNGQAEWGGQAAAALAPTVAELESRAAAIREQELARLFRRLAGATPAQQAAIRASVQQIVDQVLDDPIHGLCRAASQRAAPDVSLAQFRCWFGLDAGPASRQK
jgi:glutamyl-tRNA reductase